MIRKYKVQFVISALILLSLISYFLFHIIDNLNLTRGELTTGPKYKLDVLVIKYPTLNQSPDQTPAAITDTSIEVLPVNGGQKSIQPLDNTGRASFNLPAGNYTVQIISGYTGREKVDLIQDTTITIKAISINQ